MTTIADALKATLDAQWAIPTGGTEPIWYVSDDTSVPPPNGIDYVLIQSYTLTTRVDPINDTYANKTHRIEMEVNTPTGDNRLKELADEVERILNTVAITGVNWQKVTHRENISDKRIPFFRERVTCSLLEILASSTGAYGSVSATTFTADHLIGTIDTTTAALAVSGAATVGTTLGVTGAATVGSVVTAGNVDGVDVSAHAATSTAHHALTLAASCADVTVTTTQLEDLLMFGSANAAYVPCVFELSDTVGKVNAGGATLSATVSNVDGTDNYLRYTLPVPTVKGALKLYITGCRIVIQDADAGDYVTAIAVYGGTHTGWTQIMTDATDRTAQGTYTGTVAATDMSGYTGVLVWVSCVCTDANDLDIAAVAVNCYYAA